MFTLIGSVAIDENGYGEVGALYIYRGFNMKLIVAYKVDSGRF